MSFVYLLIEFLDELVFGIGETAWPLIRTGLHLTYTQIGLLADKFGLGIAIWLLLLGPLALIIGLPRHHDS